MDALVAALGSKVITDPNRLPAYQHDRAYDPQVVPPRAVVVAESTDDVAATLRWANDNGAPVIVRGLGSSLSGGSSSHTPSIVLSLEKLTDITVDPAHGVAIAGAGAINADVKKAAAAHGLWYPPDPSSFEFCSIGGNVATNAGGLCCVKYGVTRDYVLGLTVVLADGEVLTLGGKNIKDVAGLPLLDLFIGSEGILGVVTDVTVRLLPQPLPPATLVAFFPSLESASSAVVGIKSRLVPSMAELMDRTAINAVEERLKMGLDCEAEAFLVVQVDSGTGADDEVKFIEEQCLANGATECFFTLDPDEGEMFITARREGIPAVERLGPLFLEDVGVPVPQLPRLMAGINEIAANREVTIAMVAHAGDGNTHPLLVLDPQDEAQQARAKVAYGEIMDLAISLGGTITGEHGVGRLKQPWLTGQVGPRAYELTRQIKQVFDPNGILNPGVIVASQ